MRKCPYLILVAMFTIVAGPAIWGQDSVEKAAAVVSDTPPIPERAPNFRANLRILNSYPHGTRRLRTFGGRFFLFNMGETERSQKIFGRQTTVRGAFIMKTGHFGEHFGTINCLGMMNGIIPPRTEEALSNSKSSATNQSCSVPHKTPLGATSFFPMV